MAKPTADKGQHETGGISIFAQLVGWLHLKADHELLPQSIIRYVPISVLLNFLGVVVLVTLGFGTLREAFLTNVPLNGLIVSIMMIGIGMSVVANLKLWRTGLYLFDLNQISMQFRIRDEELENLQRQLKNKGAVLDCKNMQNLLDNVRTMGALNVTDNDARMIKSVLGARIDRGRGKVSFLSGLLLMLGLLGTFLGLLGTIDAIGDAMSGIGSNSDGGDGMTGFIASLSAPLQGMGLAFSSSLFGVSGSLLVGLFQYFSSGAQDHFLDCVSRWLDEQTPGVDQADKTTGLASGGAAVTDAELKESIVTFIQSSQNMQRELAEVVGAILATADASRQSMEATQSVLVQQASLAETLSTLNQGVVSMMEQQRFSQSDEREQTALPNQFRCESDLLKKTIGENISTAAHKDDRQDHDEDVA